MSSNFLRKPSVSNSKIYYFLTKAENYILSGDKMILFALSISILFYLYTKNFYYETRFELIKATENACISSAAIIGPVSLIIGRKPRGSTGKLLYIITLLSLCLILGLVIGCTLLRVLEPMSLRA